MLVNSHYVPFALFLFISVCNGFMIGTPSRLLSTELWMAGGRSLEEKKFSKRQLFHQLRDKLTEAAKQPGFLDDGTQIKSEIDLYVKAFNDGKQIGDCPYSQFVQLILQKKGVPYELKLTLPTNKPSWLIENHDGRLPAIVHKNNIITDSLKIAEYIEQQYPQNSLSKQGAFTYQEILEKTRHFFPAAASFIKNKDESKDTTLKAKLEEQLDLLDDLLRSTPGQYLCGLDMTLADLYLLPQLFHAVVASDHLKDYQILHLEGDFLRPALESYISRMMDMQEFNSKRVYVGVDKIVHGWKLARKEV